MDKFQQKVMLNHIATAKRIDIYILKTYVKEFLALNPKMYATDIVFLSTFANQYKEEALRLRTLIFKHSRYERDRYMESFLKFMKEAQWINLKERY